MRLASTRRMPKDQTDFEVLPPLPDAVGVGAALAHRDGRVFALRGGLTRDVYVYDTGARSWSSLPALPEETLAPGTKAAGLVANALGLFAVSGDEVWHLAPDARAWTRFATLGFVLQSDGGMLTGHGEAHLYVAEGGISTRLGRLAFDTGRFEELGPPPPDTVASEGNRMAILRIALKDRLHLHRGHNSNELLWIHLDELSPLEAPREK